MSKPFDMDRLGGPPGLFDAPNSNRGGVVLRARVPEATEGKDFMGIGPFDVPSLADSDDGAPDRAAELAKLKQDAMCSGVAYRKSITGDKM